MPIWACRLLSDKYFDELVMSVLFFNVFIFNSIIKIKLFSPGLAGVLIP